jgi:hypothetical protein
VGEEPDVDKLIIIGLFVLRLAGTALALPMLHRSLTSKVHGPTHVYTRQTCVGPPIAKGPPGANGVGFD